jgi:hypothetical protein
VRQPQQDDKPNAAGLADEIALQDKADFSNAEWELIVSALRALAYPPSAEGSTDIKLSDRIRPNSEAAPWVIEEIRKLERRCAKSHVVTSPPAGYTLVESELFNEICRALTPEQQRGICIAEGERWMRSTDRGNA